MEDRTQEQFNEILESVINGQRKQAAEQVVEYGFDVEELKYFFNEDEVVHDVDTVWRLASVAELAAKIKTEALYSDC